MGANPIIAHNLIRFSLHVFEEKEQSEHFRMVKGNERELTILYYWGNHFSFPNKLNFGGVQCTT